MPESRSEELREALRAIETAINHATAVLDPKVPADGEALVDLDRFFSIVLSLRRKLEEGRWPGRRVTSFPPGWKERRD